MIYKPIAPCIYCEGNFDFTREHVVPACIGGDDKRWSLSNCVCRNCNNAFSALEADFARSSPVAFARLVSQSAGRDRGKNTKPLTMRTEGTFLTGADGITLAARIGARLQATIAAQITQVGPKQLRANGSVEEEINLLLEKLRNLPSSVSLIRKQQENKAFVIKRCNFSKGGYELAPGSETQDKPPDDGVWIEPIHSLASLSRSPYVVLESNGQLTCHADTEDDAAAFLELARSIDAAASAADGSAVDDQNPCVAFSLQTNMRALDRVIVKIGLNIIAHWLGAHAIREEQFATARAFVRHGVGEVRRFPPMEHLQRLPGMFEEKHVFHIMPTKVEGSTHVLFLPWLYGSGYEVYELAVIDDPELVPRARTILVDFKANRIMG